MACTEPAISKPKSTPPPVRSFTLAIASGSLALTVSVAPSLRASSSLSSWMSSATTWLAPATCAPNSALSPTPPRPTTATRAPGNTCAVLSAAPTPVSTAQPNSAASSNGRLRSIFTTEPRFTTQYSANADTPTWWYTGWPSWLMRSALPSSVPAPLAFWPGSQRPGCPSLQAMHSPQLGANTITTWSPAATSCTPGPHSTTTPAASCPSTMGVCRGRSPLMLERSEWHSPAAFTCTSSSRSPGFASSTSSIASGCDWA